MRFPEGFKWGVQNIAPQIETATAHQWKDFEARDGFRFHRTCDHEQYRREDAQLFARLGNLFHFSPDWSKLQSAPLSPFDEEVKIAYQVFLQKLQEEGTETMMSVYNFAHPQWFEEAGGWEKEDNVTPFVDYSRRCARAFGPFVSHWNTFHEPNTYAFQAFLLKNFPPHRRSLRKLRRVLHNMGLAHAVAYDILKTFDPTA
ncbi:MAG: family 1 glycosylhydrolase, partial [Saprospiraceae bacterium]|nr:family 1 glycosylhydrolase [Saprospiraceae bacterium]